MIAPFFLLFSGSFCCPVGMGKGLFIFPGRLCGCCGLMETDLYGFQGQVFCPVTQLAGIVVAPAPDGAVFFQGEGMVGAGRDFDNVGQYLYRCRPLRSRFSGHRPDAICPDATVIFEDQDGFVAQGDVGDVIDELDFDGIVACRSAVLYSTHISNTQMQAEQLFLSAFAGKTIFLKEGFTMKKDGYYSSGEFARMAHVTLRTIRYYDKQNILKPSYVTESGARFYTDEDFARLSQILLLKYLGFSLDDIREMTIDDSDYHFMENSLNIQLKLVRDRIEQMQLVEKAIQDTTDAIRSHHAIDWNQMLDLIHLTGMEKSMKNQYQNASNISSRINLHSLYSQNKQGWFPWVYEQCQIHPGMRILELGCGDGVLWTQNISSLPVEISVTLSDLSSGMLRDARRAIGRKDSRFSFEAFDCARIPHEDRSFDLVIANHVLFYCEDIPAVCSEIQRVLTPGGKLICSTYGKKHMQEVSRLVRDFDDRIVLSADRLYERFGRENGADILAPYFSRIFWESYRDSLLVPDAEPLISYILSCHGNQNQYLLDKYKDFRGFVSRKTKDGFFITKDAGIFLCEK